MISYRSQYEDELDMLDHVREDNAISEEPTPDDDAYDEEDWIGPTSSS